MPSTKLSSETPIRCAIPCKICGNRALPFDTVDFNKCCSKEDIYLFGFSGIRVDYYQCKICGAIFTDYFDAWTTADFARHVYNDDYIQVDREYESIRPTHFANDMAKRWGNCRDARILDYGSGAGVFAAEMRRLGFLHIESYDPFSSPERPSGTFDIITCCEVIEHTPSPLATMRDMAGYLKDDGCIIVTQTLQPSDIDYVRANWWYVAPRNGHICTYNANTMAVLAQSSGFVFHYGKGPYGFSRKHHSPFAARALADVGRPHYFVALTAPGEVVAENWHEVEHSEFGDFRWTSARRLRWAAPAMPHLPGTVRVLMPIADQIEPNFHRGATVSIGWRSADLKREGDALVANLSIRRGAKLIKVSTQRPITPRALKGANDDRPLGLAVLGTRTP